MLPDSKLANFIIKICEVAMIIGFIAIAIGVIIGIVGLVKLFTSL